MAIDPEIRLHIRDREEEFREHSDQRYAYKIVEKIVFGMVSLILVGVIGALLGLIFQ